MVRMKKALFLILVIALPLASFGGRCSGGAHCTACKNCSYCKHCAQQGGTCSVCRPNLYSKKKQVKAKKP